MEDGRFDALILILLFIDIAITIYLLVYIFKLRKKNFILSTNNENLKNKSLVLLASNQILKSTNDDYKKTLEESQMKRAQLAKELEFLNGKLDDKQKKLQSFSKMINEMKNS
jgi:ABC-type Fe3+-citrate transport system substrate-binding protein